MKRKSWLLILIVVLMAGLMLTGCSSGNAPENENKETGEKEAATEETITLKYAFFAPANTFPAVQMEKWKEELEKRTNGKVEVQLFPGGTLLKAQNMYDGVLSGVADIGLSCPSYEPGRFPLFSIADMPVGYPSGRVASVVLWDLIQEFQPASLEEFKVITVFATEPSFIMSTDRIANLEDLKGKELRISGGNAPVLQALGAAPVGMGMGEVSEALQTGVIEGNISSREVLKDFKFVEKTKYVSDYPLTTTSFAAVMNKKTWDSLPADVQQVIDELGREMALFAGGYLDDYVDEVLEWGQKEQGLEIVSLSAEEKQKWDELIMPFAVQAAEAAEAEGLAGSKFLDRLFELRDKYSEQYK